jgi:hypothetical protein
MNRLFRLAALLAVALAVLVPVAPPSARADTIGGVIIIPGSGSDLEPIRLRTSAGCPAKATAYLARMKGHGFPPDGQIVTANTKPGLSHSFGFDVYFAVNMRDFAQLNNSTLSGRYDITVLCIDRLALHSYGEFTGSLQFTSPTHFEALGAAKLAGPPPPPLALAAGGSAQAPPAAPPAAPAPLEPGPPVSPTQGQEPPPLTARPVPGDNSETPSTARPLASQPTDVPGRRVPWLTLVLIGAALLIAVGSAANKIRKRHSS